MQRTTNLLATAAPSLLCLALASGCDSGVGPGVSFTVHAQLSDGSALHRCSDTMGVTRLEFKALSADGLSAQPGFPKSLDCAQADTFTDGSLPAGKYVLEVTAIGPLAGDQNGVLYRARRSMSLPEDATIELSLEPQIAFLKLAWQFNGKSLETVCRDEIDHLSLFISTGAAGTGSYQNLELPCTASPYVVPSLFLPQQYTIQLDALAKETGLKLYAATDTRILERGQNPEFTVVLRPIGNRIHFDFRFAIGAAMADACDDARVAATSVLAKVISADGDEPVLATIPCSAQRPIEFPGASFTKGRPLELDVSADGAHRFLGKKPFVLTMDGDADLGLLTLNAVGSATISVSVTSTACAGINTFVASVEDATSHMQVFTGPIAATGGSLYVPDVPYGDYDIWVRGLIGMTEKCSASSREHVTGRENAWAPLSL
ncbi:MAG: hypothetical protein U1E65_04165 [Myxococcota bacterium]